MKKALAIKLYIDHSPQRRHIFGLLLKWDTRRSIRMNAGILGIRPEMARMLAKGYKLGFKKVGSGAYDRKAR